MAALLAIVPSTAVAVTATYTSIVDAKTRAYAQVTNGGQLNVRGTVTTSDVVPTRSWSNIIKFEDIGHPIRETQFLWSAPAGEGITVGEVSVFGNDPGGPPEEPNTFLDSLYVPAGAACPTGAFNPKRLWLGAPARNSDTAADFTFPIPLTVEAHAKERSCLYVEVFGYHNYEYVSVVGAQGPSN